jgi:hypothetical protein
MKNRLYTAITRSRTWVLALVLAIGTLNVTLPALAHGGMEHITGTVTSVGDNSLTVKTTKGKTVKVNLDAKTAYSHGKTAAKMADLKEGDRVVIHAMEMNEVMVAHEVEIGANKVATTTTKKSTK